jgi:hypothetical protein
MSKNASSKALKTKTFNPEIGKRKKDKGNHG